MATNINSIPGFITSTAEDPSGRQFIEIQTSPLSEVAKIKSIAEIYQWAKDNDHSVTYYGSSMSFQLTPDDSEKWEPGSNWDQHHEYPAEDWSHEIQNGDTRLGYHEWVNAKLESDE